MEPLQLVALFSAAIILLAAAARAGRNSGRLPPGPKGLPLVGNLFNMPIEHQWLTFSNWSKKYGDIMSVQFMGHNVVILESAQAVQEVLVQRAMQTGGRMRMFMLEHSGWENDVGLLPPDKHRVVRRFMTKYLGPSALSPYRAVVDDEISHCIMQFLRLPGVLDPESHIKRMAGSIILRITYGYKIISENDELVDISQQALELALEMTSPGWIIDAIPWLKFLPDWMLGRSFCRTVARSRALVKAARTIPIKWTENDIASGKENESLAAKLLEIPEDENTSVLFTALADLYIGGIDTTVSACKTLLLVLALYPEVQLKAQSEVDNLTRGERLPSHYDRMNLPYVCALIKEVYRFRGVANLALPHCAIQEVRYNGYTIPKGAIILPNIWGIFHNPEKYPDPFTFSPERFLSGERVELVNEDTTRYAFGFGARHCPGKYVADSTLFLFAARILATCCVSRPINERCEIITPESVEYTGGVVS